MPYDGATAASYANNRAAARSRGRCAEYVRHAIEHGGQPIAPTPSAKDMGTALRHAGFSGTAQPPEPGDVVVIQPAPGHPHGHAAIYDGSRWISDFVQQHGLYPGPAYRQARPPYRIYRHQGEGTP